MMASRICFRAVMRAFAVALSFLAYGIALAGPDAGYKALAPMVSIAMKNASSVVTMLHNGLSGIGSASTEADCEAHLAKFLFIPSLDCLDRNKQIRYYLLSKDPPSSLPEPAVLVPLSFIGADTLLKGFKERYKTVEGGGIKICVDPVDGTSIEPMYFAIAGDVALISPNVDAIRWMAHGLQTSTLPDSGTGLRDSPVSLSANAPLLGLFFELVASLDASSVPEEATAGNALLHIRELGKAFSLLSSIDISLSATHTRWNIALKFEPQAGGALAKSFAAMPAPRDDWMTLFPPMTRTRSVDPLPAFVAALPHSNRRWLASLADNTRLLGYSIFPAMHDLDEATRPFLTGRSATQFLADRPNAYLGGVSFFEVSDAPALKKAIDGYFSENGSVALNRRIRARRERECGDFKVIECDIAPLRVSTPTGVGQTGAAVSHAVNLDHVEMAVREGKLIVARGPSGMIDRWLSDRPVTTWEEKASIFGEPFPEMNDGDVFLGGGTVAPMAIVRGILNFIPDLRYLMSKLPLPGDGFSWRMTRNGSNVTFDVLLSANELLACSMLKSMGTDAMQEFLSSVALRNFQRTSDEENRQEHLREKLRELRDK